MATVKTRSEELLTLITTGKATASQKLEFATLLQTESKEEAEKEKMALMEKGKDTLIEMGISIIDFAIFLKGNTKALPIFTWIDDQGKDHIRYEGERGKMPAWVKDMTRALTKSKALEIAGDNDKAKKFVASAYKT